MTTGMIRPFCEAVLALKFLQKSMMLTPCCPSAGPTGGAGVASPAGISSLTQPVIFFALTVCLQTCRASRANLTRTRLQLLNLQELELDGRASSEDRDHHLQGASVEV